jgi:hypothetical protein
MQAGRNIGAAMRGAEAVQNLTSEEEAGFLALGYIFQCFVKDHTDKK